MSRRERQRGREERTLVLEHLEQLNLPLQRLKHALLPFLVVRVARRKLDLLDGHQRARQGVHAEVDAAERALTD